jgi:hypothetical protein
MVSVTWLCYDLNLTCAHGSYLANSLHIFWELYERSVALYLHERLLLALSNDDKRSALPANINASFLLTKRSPATHMEDKLLHSISSYTLKHTRTHTIVHAQASERTFSQPL